MRIDISRESKRGCGYRSTGADGVGLYFVGPAFSRHCGRLPKRLAECPVCGGGIHHFRGTKWINPRALFGGESSSPTGLALRGILDALDGLVVIGRVGAALSLALERAKAVLAVPEECGVEPCPASCAFNARGMPEKAILMWVGEKFYPTPGAFLEEAERMGVSKKLGGLPDDWEPGTLVYLAHPKAVAPWHADWVDPVATKDHGDLPLVEGGTEKAPDLKPQPGVFAVFRPTLEVVLDTDNPEQAPRRAHELAKKFGDNVRFVKVERIEDEPESQGEMFPPEEM